jgi:MFS family permease
MPFGKGGSMAVAAPVTADVFPHVRGLLAIVVALGLARLLSGLGRFLEHKRQKPLYLTHLLWVAIVLLSTIHFWWFELGLASIHPIPFELFVFVCSYAFIYYLLATLLIPDNIDEYSGYEDYFLSRRRWFFGLFALTMPVDLIDTLVKGQTYYHALGIEYPIRLAVVTVLSLIAAWTRNRKFQLAFAALYLVYLTTWILRLYDVLE